MPPFGHLYGMLTYADKQLAESDTIYMNAGNHKELLALSWDSFVGLVDPKIGDIAVPSRRSSVSRKGSGRRVSDATMPAPEYCLAEA